MKFTGFKVPGKHGAVYLDAITSEVMDALDDLQRE